MDSLAIDCMLKQKEKDTIIAARGRRVESLRRVAIMDSVQLADNLEEIDGLRSENETYRYKQKNSWWKVLLSAVGGIILGHSIK